MNKKHGVIGLTGPTGAGKTTVSRYLQAMGAVIVDCDQLARQAVEDPRCLALLQEAFGVDVAAGGSLNRHKVAQRAFASDEKTRLLNQITHPFIIELTKKQVEQALRAGKTAVIDAPVLFEAGLETICDCTIAVVAPFAVRLNRIMNRDGLTREEAQLRMARQHGEEYYRERADILLNGASSCIEEEVKAALEPLQVMI